jgi:hypothetical protein
MEFDEEEYLPEVDIFSRVEAETQILVGSKDKFFVFVDAISRQLSQDHIVRISNAEIQDMLERLTNVKEPQYKNPTGVVLGYYVTGGGGYEIDKQRFASLKPKLSKLDKPIKATDVIRYANLWITQLS